MPASPARALDDIGEAGSDEVIAGNLKSCFLVTQAVLPDTQPGLRPHHQSLFGGRAGRRGRRPAYAAIQSRNARADAGRRQPPRGEGITVNAIAPALIETEMVTSDPNATPEDSRRPARATWMRSLTSR